MKVCLLLITATVLFLAGVSAQGTSKISNEKFVTNYASTIKKKVSLIESKLAKKSEKWLRSFEKQEAKLRRKLAKKDSAAAAQMLANANEKYAALKTKLKAGGELKQYVPSLDSMNTALKFLNVGGVNVGKVNDALGKVKDLQSELAKVENIKQFLKERKQYLKEQFGKFGFAKDLQKINKQAYYYGEQCKEYVSLLKDKTKREKKALELLSKTKVFQDFMERNSFLATFFRMPSATDPGYAANMAGLQTRADLSTILNQQVSAGGPNAQQQFQQQIQTAQQEIQKLKAKILPQGGSSDEPMPDFKPNNQKTKSFLQRIEWGSNLQTSKSNFYFPVTSDIGVSAGYKLNDKSIIGIGASYKVGLGQGWQNMSITHQGAGLRTFVDVKLKGNFWISGGGEMNYRTAFRRIDVLKDMNAWQQSALLGISKKYKAGKKFKGNAQVLYDFLWKQQQPRTQPIVFRVGYSLK